MPELPENLRGDLKLLRHLDAEIAQLKGRIKELEEVAADAEYRIQEYMKDETELTQDGVPVVVWTKVTQKRLNQKMLRENFPRIWDACKKESSYRVFSVVRND